MKNNTSFDKLSNTRKGTKEQGALKEIHRGYNKLNGYEAMLHIINRYRFVLYPFIFLSVVGSSYSFFNDFIKAFPMLGDTANLTIAIFFSIMLEIVRDGSLIAIFNGKMHLPSRILVITIFVAVTTYMYSSHLKAIDVIENMAVEYTLQHQSDKEISTTNPRYEVAIKELQGLEESLKNKEAEKTPELIANSTSIHKAKREDALNRIDRIDAKIEDIKAKISEKNTEIIGYKDTNIKSIEDSQKLISNILLATLLLIESLAMLGAVIKFINKDNAQKEIAKHNEIVEEYVEISEQMKQDNEALTKNLSNIVRGQSESNQNVMGMISNDMQETAKMNIQFIHAIAQNKNEMMKQMNQVLSSINSSTAPTFEQPKAPEFQPHPTSTEKPERKIGFKFGDSDDGIEGLGQSYSTPYNERREQGKKIKLQAGVEIINDVILENGKIANNIELPKFDYNPYSSFRGDVFQGEIRDKHDLLNAFRSLGNGQILKLAKFGQECAYYRVWCEGKEESYSDDFFKKNKTNKTQSEKQNPENLITKLWDDGRVKAGEKLISKTHIINVDDRSEDKIYKSVMKTLADNKVVDFRIGYGYYAVGGIDEALRVL